MSITGILIAAACVGIVGIFVGLFLGVAGIKFKVEVDEKEEAVLAALPGNNSITFVLLSLWKIHIKFVSSTVNGLFIFLHLPVCIL